MLSANQPLGIDQCNCSAMRRASRQITRFYDSHLDPVGLRITQFLILAALEEGRGATVNTLAERLDVERTAMGKMVGFLERDGFVSIRPSPKDGRVRVVELTDEGLRLHKKAQPFWQAAQREFEQLNGSDNITALRQELNRMDVGNLPASVSGD